MAQAREFPRLFQSFQVNTDPWSRLILTHCKLRLYFKCIFTSIALENAHLDVIMGLPAGSDFILENELTPVQPWSRDDTQELCQLRKK